MLGTLLASTGHYQKVIMSYSVFVAVDSGEDILHCRLSLLHGKNICILILFKGKFFWCLVWWFYLHLNSRCLHLRVNPSRREFWLLYNWRNISDHLWKSGSMSIGLRNTSFLLSHFSFNADISVSLSCIVFKVPCIWIALSSSYTFITWAPAAISACF